MRHALAVVVAGIVTVGVILLLPAHGASGGDDNGHDAVTLCHWVPAHGGSFVTITVDDDGSPGNDPLEAHLAHENDIIPAPEEGCPETPTETDTPTATSTSTETPTDTATPVPTNTSTDTPEPTSTDTPTATETLTSTAAHTPTAESTPELTATPTPTFGFTPGTTPCVEDEVFDAVTGECIHIDRISPSPALPAELPSTGIDAPGSEREDYDGSWHDMFAVIGLLTVVFGGITLIRGWLGHKL